MEFSSEKTSRSRKSSRCRKASQALIYEPSEGAMRLVGVEFVMDQATWLGHNDSPPVLEDQVFQLVPAPNRFHLPASLSYMSGVGATIRTVASSTGIVR